MSVATGLVQIGRRVPGLRNLRRVFSRDFARDGAIVFASTFCVNVLNYVIHFVLSRKLGVDTYGSFASLISVLAIAGIPATLVATIVVKYVAEFHAAGDAAKVRVLSQRVLAGGTVLAILFFAAGLALRAQMAAYLHLADALSVVATCLTWAIAFVLPSLRGVLQGTQDFTAFAISTVIEGIGRVAFAVALAFAGFGVVGVLFGYAGASALAVLYSVFAIRRHWGSERTRLSIDSRRLLQTTGGVIAGTAAITVMGFVDIPLVKHFFTPADAGLYSAAAVCGRMVYFLVGFVPMLVLPKATRSFANGNSARNVLLQGLLLTAALAAVALAGFLLAPGLIVRVTYGAAFIGASRYLFLYGVAMALLSATNVVWVYAIGLHRYQAVVPLVTGAVLEVVGIQLFHGSLWMVIGVLIAVNLYSFIGSLSTFAGRLLHKRPAALISDT